MAVARVVEWRVLTSPERTRKLLTSAFEEVGLEPVVASSHLTGHRRAKLTRNKMAANVTAIVAPYGQGSVVKLNIEMPLGSGHYAIADEIAEQLDEEMFDDRGLKDAIDRLGAMRKLAGWMELRSLRHHLSATENVREIGQGVWGKRQALVVLTDERLFLFDKGLAEDRLEEFPLGSITSVATRRALNGESLLVTVASNVLTIERMKFGQGEAIARGCREVMSDDFGSRTSSRSPQPPGSKADELAKFAVLHEQGVLTDQEFAEVKARLLGQ